MADSKPTYAYEELREAWSTKITRFCADDVSTDHVCEPLRFWNCALRAALDLLAESQRHIENALARAMRAEEGWAEERRLLAESQRHIENALARAMRAEEGWAEEDVG